MGLFFRRSKQRGPTRVTVTNSGVSASRRFGPLSISTRGNVSLRLGRGLGFRKKLF